MEPLPEEITSEAAKADMFEIKKVFDHFGVPIFLTYGALLGIYRDGDFIPYDDDIDLCITEPIDHKTRKAIGWKLYDLGFTGQPISFRVYDRMEPAEMGYNGDGESGIIVCQKRIRTTLFFFKEEPCDIHDRDMVCIPKYKGWPLISCPAKFFDKPGKITFKGETFITPHPIKEYLEYVYGKDWRKPIKGKHAKQYLETHPSKKQEILGGEL